MYWALQAHEFVPLHEVKIALNDAGFMYGATVTDQCRTYNLKLFRLDDHLQRFERSCDLCQIGRPFLPEILRGQLVELLKRNIETNQQVAEWSLVWLLTAGKLDSFFGKPNGILDASPQLVAYALPLDETRFRSYYESGAEVIIARTVHSDDSVSPWAKQRSRMHWWIAEHEVKSQSRLAHPLLLSRDGYITETTTSNLVLVRDGKVHSPPRHRILQGISLKVLEEICCKLSIPFIYEDLSEGDLATADEAILTSTPFGIAPVGKLAGKIMTFHGTLFTKVKQAWMDMVMSLST